MNVKLMHRLRLECGATTTIEMRRGPIESVDVTMDEALTAYGETGWRIYSHNCALDGTSTVTLHPGNYKDFVDIWTAVA